MPPSRRISQVPNRLSRISSRIVHHGPITWPTWISTQISTSGTPMKAANSASLTHRRRVVGRVIASSPGAAHGPLEPGHASRSPQPVIRRSDSTATAPLIFESPRTRSTNSIGTSRTVRPARRVRATRSVWNT